MKKYNVSLLKPDGNIEFYQVEKIEIQGNALMLKECSKPPMEGEDFNVIHSMAVIANVNIFPVSDE